MYPIDENEKAGLVYEIPCKDCSKVYISETKRTLNDRTKEHKKACKNNEPEKSAWCEHALNQDHIIDWKNRKILHYEDNW